MSNATAIKAIGYVEFPKFDRVRGESLTARVSFYAKRIRKAHTQVQVMRDGALTWRELPESLDPQHVKDAPFVVYEVSP